MQAYPWMDMQLLPNHGIWQSLLAVPEPQQICLMSLLLRLQAAGRRDDGSDEIR